MDLEIFLSDKVPAFSSGQQAGRLLRGFFLAARSPRVSPLNVPATRSVSQTSQPPRAAAVGIQRRSVRILLQAVAKS